MEIPQIKDKITARAFALSLANSHRFFNEKLELSITDRAKEFEKYIIGDAELPEVAEDPSMQILNMWNKLKENMEKNEMEMSKRFEELHSKLPLETPDMQLIYELHKKTRTSDLLEEST